MGEKKRAVGYVRVSSKQQAASGESLTTQRKAIKDFVKSQEVCSRRETLRDVRCVVEETH